AAFHDVSHAPDANDFGTDAGEGSGGWGSRSIPFPVTCLGTILERSPTRLLREGRALTWLDSLSPSFARADSRSAPKPKWAADETPSGWLRWARQSHPLGQDRL